MSRRPLKLGCAAIGLTTLTAACGGATTTSPSPPSSNVSLAPGDYALSVSASTSQVGGGPGTAMFCTVISFGPLPLGPLATFSESATIPVHVEAVGLGWAIRPVTAVDLGLTATLDPTGAMLGGRVRGRARDPQTGVTVTFGSPSGEEAILSGMLSGSTRASGTVVGPVDFSRDGTSRGCSANIWGLRSLN